MATLELFVAAAVAYVLVRAGWIFGGSLLVATALVVLAAVAYATWRRGRPAVTVGIALGAAFSAVALTA